MVKNVNALPKEAGSRKKRTIGEGDARADEDLNERPTKRRKWQAGNII